MGPADDHPQCAAYDRLSLRRPVRLGNHRLMLRARQPRSSFDLNKFEFLARTGSALGPRRVR